MGVLTPCGRNAKNQHTEQRSRWDGGAAPHRAAGARERLRLRAVYRHDGVLESSARRVALVAAALVALAVAVWPRYPVASVAYDEVESRRVGRPLIRTAEALGRGPKFLAAMAATERP